MGDLYMRKAVEIPRNVAPRTAFSLMQRDIGTEILDQCSQRMFGKNCNHSQTNGLVFFEASRCLSADDITICNPDADLAKIGPPVTPKLA